MFRHPARFYRQSVIKCLVTVSAPFVWFANPAHAGGFALIEHGASGLGHAYAGSAAVSNDTSTVWFNPAGMSEIDGREIAVGVHILDSDNKWTDRGTTLGYALGGAEVSGPETANPGVISTLPNFYYVAPIDEKWRYGLSIGVPFGSSTEYDADWKGRYTAVEGGINVIDINPAFSYEVSEKISLGFGLSIQQLTAELGSSVDSGAVCLSFGLREDTSFSSADCVNADLTPGNLATDSTAEISGDSTAISFNFGALFQPREDIKLGVAYRHSVEHELDGDADFGVNAELRALLDGNTSDTTQAITQGFLRDGKGDAEVSLPATLSFSGAWQVNDKIQLMSDLTWTGWSTFEELRVTYETPVQPDSVTVFAWDDAIRFSAGLSYLVSPRMTLRGGYAFDESPIPGPQRRTTRIPGNDRTWITAGLGYQVNSNFSFDVGYALIMLDDTPIDNLYEEQNGAGTEVRGIYEPSVNILSAQINWDF